MMKHLVSKFAEDLRDYICSIAPEAKVVSGGREITMKCKFCGDSRKIGSQHLYIFLGDDNKPPMYHCFKCGESGLLTRKTLQEILGYSVFLSDYITSELERRSKDFKKKSQYEPRQNRKYMVYYNYPMQMTKNIQAKMMYINNRLGVNLSLEEMVSNKIVLDLDSMLGYNRLQIKSLFWKDASKYSIGFLTMDNAYVTLRNISNKLDFRYKNYNIFDSYDTSMRFYCIPHRLNPTNPYPVNIHIAEGAFDILSVCYNLCGGDKINNIFLASNGKGYHNVLKFMLSTYPLVNVIIHIYLDNDVESSYVHPLCDYLTDIGIPVYLHRNSFQNEKDYGVPAARIVDNVIRYRKGGLR